MLTITIPINPEGWDEKMQEFVPPKVVQLQLEHSLLSLAKWESKWCKSFLSNRDKTNDEIIDYIKCMTLTKNVNPELYGYLTLRNIKQIEEYIQAPMTATYFPDDKKSGGRNDTITAELIYYWMVCFNIPFECERWHLNRLIALIRVCEVKNQPNKKLSQKDIMSRNAALNAARRKQLNSKG